MDKKLIDLYVDPGHYASVALRERAARGARRARLDAFAARAPLEMLTTPEEARAIVGDNEGITQEEVVAHFAEVYAATLLAALEARELAALEAEAAGGQP